MVQWNLALLAALPLAAAPASWLIGRHTERGRDAFVLLVTAAELLLAAALLLQPPGCLTMERLCGLGLSFRSGGLRTALALLACAGWLAPLRQILPPMSCKRRFPTNGETFIWVRRDSLQA